MIYISFTFDTYHYQTVHYQSSRIYSMRSPKRSFWLTLGLVNLCIVALLGFALRSKILFSLPFIDFRSVESAHSHFAFAGWAGLSLITFFIYDILPEHLSQKKIYQWVLAGIEISSLGMAFLFPFLGYTGITIFFSTLYVAAAVAFVPVFIKDVLQTNANRNVKLLSISALCSLILSFAGTIGLSYIIIAKSGGSLLYRDSIYTFLHFQYNGFFTLSIFALFINYIVKNGILPDKNANLFSLFLSLSILPALFLSLLWHNSGLFYVLGTIGCFFILMAVIHLFLFFKNTLYRQLFKTSIARNLWYFSMISFALKMILQVGTIFPRLGNAVYGDRPVIIGFLHLVFLGFVTFFILSVLVENGYFNTKNKIISFPLILFSIGVFANEILLMVQGLGILFQTNNSIFNWLLWGAAIILFTGALSIACARLFIVFQERQKNKATLSDGF
jgi:hypothetical protein